MSNIFVRRNDDKAVIKIDKTAIVDAIVNDYCSICERKESCPVIQKDEECPYSPREILEKWAKEVTLA